MAKNKQPYIPLYIGDWEQDTNLLSLEAEGAWLKIVFKMFKGDKSGVYKISTNALQNLWRKNTHQVNEIIKELKDAETCTITILEGYIEFGNRRMINEKNISKIRSTSVQNRYKTSTNNLHPLDNEYDNEDDNEIVNKITNELKIKSRLFQEIFIKLISSAKWKKKTPSAINLSFVKLIKENEKEAIEMMNLTIENNWQGIFPLKNNSTGKQKINYKNVASDEARSIIKG